jgi:hypothetical protein
MPFSGHRPAKGVARAPGAKLVDMSRAAGVSTGTVSNVLNRPDTVPVGTREKVAAAVAELGYVRGGPAPGELAPHWRRSGFATWLFRPAATGWYPPAAPHPARPVPILGEPWPGIPARGAAARANACWLPLAKGLVPHGLRHSHKTEMDEMGVPQRLRDDRMGHLDGSVSARHSHITTAMRQALCDGLTEPGTRPCPPGRCLHHVPRSPCWIACCGRCDPAPKLRFCPKTCPKMAQESSRGRPFPMGRPAPNWCFVGRGGRI